MKSQQACCEEPAVPQASIEFDIPLLYIHAKTFPLFDYTNPLSGHLFTLDDHLSSPFLTLSSRDLGNHLLAILNRIRLDRQADRSIVVVRRVDGFWAEAQDGILSYKDGDLGERVVGLLDPSRAFDHFVGPEAGGAMIRMGPGVKRLKRTKSIFQRGGRIAPCRPRRRARPRSFRPTCFVAQESGQ